MSLYGCAEALVQAREDLKKLYNQIAVVKLTFRSRTSDALKEYKESQNKTGEIEEALEAIHNEATAIGDDLMGLLNRAEQLRVWIGQI